MVRQALAEFAVAEEQPRSAQQGELPRDDVVRQGAGPEQDGAVLRSC